MPSLAIWRLAALSDRSLAIDVQTAAPTARAGSMTISPGCHWSEMAATATSPARSAAATTSTCRFGSDTAANATDTKKIATNGLCEPVSSTQATTVIAMWPRFQPVISRLLSSSMAIRRCGSLAMNAASTTDAATIAISNVRCGPFGVAARYAAPATASAIVTRTPARMLLSLNASSLDPITTLFGVCEFHLSRRVRTAT
jgi:hypothetical protein